jgi:hypothetical protein
MKKKFLAFFAMFALLLGLASCGSVAGKTYVYGEFEYEVAEDLTKIEAGLAEAAVTVAKKTYEKVEITFNEDGTCTGGTWTKDGSNVTVKTIGEVTYKLKGSKLVLEVVEEAYSYTVTLVVKK